MSSSSIRTLDEATLRKLFDRFNIDELAEMAGTMDDIAHAKSNLGPQTKDELWWTFKERYGVELGRVAVCEGHTSQLDLVWEVYNFDVSRVLWVLSRGAGKTFLMALTDELQCEFYPGFGSFTIGPGKSQGERKYDHILPYVLEGGVIGGKEKEHIARSTVTKTEWKKGSKMEISLGGEPENANGPREPRLHRDEIELMKEKTRKQAGNIPAGRLSRDGRYMPAQIIDTSTMKWAGGYVDVSMEEYNDAIEKKVMPRQQVRISCIFESTSENPACRSVPEEQRRARLIELKRNPSELCNCDLVVSGVMPTEDPDEEAEPRTLEKVCQGRFFKGRGHKDFSDVITLFQENDPDTWDAEQECSQPARDGAYIKAYSQLRHGIRGYRPDPLYGAIYTGTDWGGTDSHSHGWYQALDRDVRCASYKSGLIRTLTAGSVIRFAEIFKAGIGDVELGQMVIEMENEWMLEFPGWVVKERYCDIANRSGRLNWRDQLGMNAFSRVQKDFKQEVKMVRTRGGGRNFFVDIKACPAFDKAIRAWRQENGHEVHDDACFVAGTQVRVEAGTKPIECVTAGEMVWTREGLKLVIWAGFTKFAKTVFVDVEGHGSLECTPEHRFWTDRGWIQAQDLTNTDTLLSWRSFARSEYVSTSSIEAADGIETQLPQISAAGATSRLLEKDCIERSGPTSGERYPMDTRSITLTETPTTTLLTILYARQEQSIVGSMGSSLRARGASIISSAFDRLLMLLWLDRKFAPHREIASSSDGQSVNHGHTRANDAVRASSQPHCANRDGVVEDASRLHARHQESTTLIESAMDAVNSSERISMLTSASASVRVLGVRQTGKSRGVYDVCVEECHEFFADGILVHNSHPMAEFRYFESNYQVIERKRVRAGKLGQTDNSPRAESSDVPRAQERKQELDGRVVVTYHGHEPGVQIMGVGGAADSPLAARRAADTVLHVAREQRRRDWGG